MFSQALPLGLAGFNESCSKSVLPIPPSQPGRVRYRVRLAPLAEAHIGPFQRTGLMGSVAQHGALGTDQCSALTRALRVSQRLRAALLRTITLP